MVLEMKGRIDEKEEVEPKKILVTGGTGFLGSWLANHLKGMGNWVRVVDILPEQFQPLVVDEVIKADLRHRDECYAVVHGMDEVYNFSANMGGIGYITSVHADIMTDNVRINTNVLDACMRFNVKKTLFASSACIYPLYKQDTTEMGELRESDAFPALPDSSYGWEKLFTELLMVAYNEDYGLETRTARLHNVYGAYTHWYGGKEKAPAGICRKVAEADNDTTIKIWGDGKQIRSFLCIMDFLDGIDALMNSDYISPLNIGSDEAISIGDFARMIIEISGKNLDIEFQTDKPQGVRARWSNNDLVKEILNWEPKIPLREGIVLLYNWVEEQVEKDWGRPIGYNAEKGRSML